MTRSHLHIITLNVNRLNAPIKRHRLTNQIESTPIAVLYSGDPSHMQRHKQVLNKGMEEYLPSKWKAKPTNQPGVAILVSDKTDFKPTQIKKDKEGHYLIVKRSMQQEELTILNIYAPNKGAPIFIRQVLNDLQGDLDPHNNSGRL